MTSKCPICCSGETSLFFQQKNSPYLQVVLCETADDAAKAGRVDITFQLCPSCRFVFNPNFLENKVEYTATYNNFQLASEKYQQYVEEVVKKLSSDCELSSDSRILEIACGNGYFLSRLNNLLQSNNIQGYDPAYNGQFGMSDYIEKTYYTPKEGETFDLIILRHCLEGMLEYDTVLSLLNSAMHAGSRLYLEFTDLEFIIRQKNPALLCHEYSRYFSLKSIQSVMKKHSFELETAKLEFNKNYVGCVFRKINQDTDIGQPFEKIKDLLPQYERVVIWGIAGRAVSFLTQTDWAQGKIKHGVDVDDRKIGKFIPVAGQLILSPKEAKEFNPELVIVSNPFYLDEIRQSFGTDCDYITLEGEYYGQSKKALS